VGGLAGLGSTIPQALVAFFEKNLSGLDFLVRRSLEIPWSDSIVFQPGVSPEAALLGFIVVLVLALTFRRMAMVLTIGVTAGLVVWGATLGWGPDASGHLVIEQPYVGHGDGALLKLPDGEVVVIDSPGPSRRHGWDPGRAVMGRMLERRGVRTIDLVVMTHPHWDHVGGFEYLSERFGISEVWLGGGHPPPKSRLARILTRIRSKGGRVVLAHALPRRMERSGLEIEVFNQRQPIKRAVDPNDESLVMRLQYRERSILFTGDISRRVEAALSDFWQPTDIVKVPHHGSDTSSSEGFIEQLKPKVSMVSCAAQQRPGIPDSDVLSRYRRLGSEVLRTDLDGAISLWSDGHVWRVRARQQRARPLEFTIR